MGRVGAGDRPVPPGSGCTYGVNAMRSILTATALAMLSVLTFATVVLGCTGGSGFPGVR